jgi:LmbE family N-acetylglucosaminyl deacetylase
MKQRVLIVVPHPDDEVLGFGGTINKHIERGNSVTVVFAEQTQSDYRYQIQAQQARLVADYLNFDYIFANIPPSQILVPDDPAILELEQIISKVRPDILYTTHPSDTHQDHTGVFNLIRIATRVCGPCPVKQIFSGEIISSADTCIKVKTNTFVPTFYETLTAENVRQKIQAMKIYSSELRDFPHPRSSLGIEIHSQKRGMETGTNYAEAFECLRYIN